MGAGGGAGRGLKNGFSGLAARLLARVFLALAGDPRAEGATRIPPAALGRVLGLDRAPEVKTISAASSASSPLPARPTRLVMALAHRHAAAKPDALGFLYADGHARAYYGTRRVQKIHVARLKFPALPPWRPGSPTPAATRCSWSWPSRRSPWPPRSSGCSRSCGRSSARARR